MYALHHKEIIPEISDKVINSRFANHQIFPYIHMYGVLQYQAHHIFLSLAHEGLLVHYIWHDF